MKTITPPLLLLGFATLLGACAGSGLDDDLEARTAEPVAAEVQAEVPADTGADPDTLSGDWTIEPTVSESEVTGGVVTLNDVRAAAHASFDRFVIAMEGGDFPAYRVEYAEDEVRQCGSGEPIESPGGATLLVRLDPARAHNDDGDVTLDAREWALNMPAVVEAQVICDFEAVVEIAIATEHVLRYRVTTLTSPHRIVIDIRH